MHRLLEPRSVHHAAGNARSCPPGVGLPVSYDHHWENDYPDHVTTVQTPVKFGFPILFVMDMQIKKSRINENIHDILSTGRKELKLNRVEGGSRPPLYSISSCINSHSPQGELFVGSFRSLPGMGQVFDCIQCLDQTISVIDITPRIA